MLKLNISFKTTMIEITKSCSLTFFPFKLIYFISLTLNDWICMEVMEWVNDCECIFVIIWWHCGFYYFDFIFHAATKKSVIYIYRIIYKKWRNDDDEKVFYYYWITMNCKKIELKTKFFLKKSKSKNKSK